MIKRVSVLILICILMTGCWDKVEINKRAFVSMVGIDKVPVEDDTEKPEEGKTKSEYIVTIAYPNAGLIAGKDGEESKYVYTSKGVNVAEIIDEFNTRLEKTLFLRHAKIIILGKELMKDPKAFREVLDYIERSPKIGRQLHIMIGDKNPDELLKTPVKDEPIVGSLIREVMNENRRTAKVTHSNLEYILKSLQESNCAIIAKVTPFEDEYKVSGSGIIKDYKLIGELNEADSRNLMYLFNKVQNSIVKVELNNQIVPIEIMRSDTKLKVEEENNSLVAKFTINSEARIASHLFDLSDEDMDDHYIKEVEKLGEKRLEEEISRTYNVIKNDYNVDLLQINERIRKFNPKLWDKISKDWDSIYGNTKVVIESNLKVRTMGVIK
ncbi:Ger(x)C family spore germination protein [Anaeromicrobium sediminis]|uniref:Uncharacterized protein n=1 Tax=Anaeromicrobium sediminis TaxID=1478221 RepID=A0A267MA80_9FIRM|nr:Ger(x)C family spore germination protein [Anaeromicrobium sediminis]PAB56312.1 hypothetical protein CCE28_21000 [Anaeromicrobium sediminis]